MKILVLLGLVFTSSLAISAVKELSDNDVLKMMDKKCDKTMTFKPDVTRVDCPRIIHQCKDVTFETCSQNNSLKVKNTKTKKYYDYNLLEKPSSKVLHDKLIAKELESNQAKKDISQLDKSDPNEKERHSKIAKLIEKECDKKMTVKNVTDTKKELSPETKQFICKDHVFEVRMLAPNIKLNVFNSKKKEWVIPKDKELYLNVPPFTVMGTLMNKFKVSDQYKELVKLKNKGK